MKTIPSNQATLSSQRGLTLVEIMVAVVIGLVLMAGILQIFIGSKQTYRVQEAMGRVQENGRVALEIMARDIRQADYWGCSYLTDARGRVVVDDNLPAGSFDYITNGGLSGTGAGAGTDSITLAGAAGAGQPVTAFSRSTNTVTVTSTAGFTVGGDAFIGDCRQADIVRITALTPTTLTFQSIFNNYDTKATIHPINRVIYSIANGSNGRTALFRSINGTNQELIQDVDSLNVLYGEDTTADRAVDNYVAAGAVGNMANVIALRVAMAMSSNQTNITTAGDTRLRKNFSSTIRLRNGNR